ncbi:MAG: hypothetical protein ACPGQT_04080 [Rhodothermales bacterium]
MNPVLKNVIAVVAGVVAGSIVNSAIVNVGPSIIPLPEGADVCSMERLAESMHLFTFWSYVPPFVAHALGTLVGAFLAVKLAASHHGKIAFGIGVFFLFGGMVAASMIGGSKIFISVDLVFAYIQMAILGQRFAGGAKSK